MVRDLDPEDPARPWSTVGAEQWTDYDTAMPYGDFEVTLDGQNNPVIGEQMRYLEGFGLPAQQTVGTSATQYLHGDLIRSTMLTTGQGGTAVSAVSHTAFGEPIGDPELLDIRYQYAGGWGYESDLLILEGAPGTAPITLQHVGFRWYDPAIGRFIQRDPLGIAGGLNVYAYCSNDPSSAVDPQGLDKWCPICGSRSLRHDPGCPCYRPPRPPAKPFWPRGFLRVTGGQRNTRLDRIGRRVGERRSSTGDNVGLGGLRVPKRSPFPGGPSTTSIWTKVPGIGLRGGQLLGRFFIPITLCMGAYDWYIIINSAVEEW